MTAYSRGAHAPRRRPHCRPPGHGVVEDPGDGRGDALGCDFDRLHELVNEHMTYLRLAGSNSCGSWRPARSVRPNPRKKITRFLSREELDRLHRVLDRRANAKRITPSQRHQIDIIRLLLLTGCRKNEIVRLRRGEVVESQLRLRDVSDVLNLISQEAGPVEESSAPPPLRPALSRRHPAVSRWWTHPASGMPNPVL